MDTSPNALGIAKSLQTETDRNLQRIILACIQVVQSYANHHTEVRVLQLIIQQFLRHKYINRFYIKQIRRSTVRA